MAELNLTWKTNVGLSWSRSPTWLAHVMVSVVVFA